MPRRRGLENSPPQNLYQDVSCLVALAYPLADASQTTHVGQEGCVAALNDKQLQLEVTKCEPRTVEEALSHAIKMEAYEQSLMLQRDSNANEGGGWSLQATTMQCLHCY